jgi:hypothetical protein
MPHGLQNRSQHYTRESLAWPKPTYCRRRQAEVCSISPHFCLALPTGNSPRASLVSQRHRLEFRQVWKVASSSLASFFFCNMWGELQLRKVMPGTPPPAQGARFFKAFASGRRQSCRLGAIPTAFVVGPSLKRRARQLGGMHSWRACEHRMTPSHPRAGEEFVVAFPSRDPIGRFIASALEVALLSLIFKCSSS